MVNESYFFFIPVSFNNYYCFFSVCTNSLRIICIFFFFNSQKKGHTILAPRLVQWFGTKIRSRKEDPSIAIRSQERPEWGPAKVVKCGRFHSCVVLGRGRGEHRLVSFGSASQGRLGHGGPFSKMMRGGGSINAGTSSSNQIEYTEIPREVLYYGQSLQVIDLACGKDHTIVLERVDRRRRRSGRNGGGGGGGAMEEEESEAVVMETRVLTWGSGVHGQLGHGNDVRFLSFLPSPKIVASLGRIHVTKVYSGGDLCFVLDQNGFIYGWGVRNCLAYFGRYYFSF